MATDAEIEDPNLYAPAEGGTDVAGLVETLRVGTLTGYGDDVMRQAAEAITAQAAEIVAGCERAERAEAFLALQTADLKRWQNLTEAATQKLVACRAALAAKETEIEALKAARNRYHYAVTWVAADSWDFCPECRSHLEWARSNDGREPMSLDEVAAVGKQWVAFSGKEFMAQEQARGVKDAGKDARIAALEAALRTVRAGTYSKNRDCSLREDAVAAIYDVVIAALDESVF